MLLCFHLTDIKSVPDLATCVWLNIKPIKLYEVPIILVSQFGSCGNCVKYIILLIHDYQHYKNVRKSVRHSVYVFLIDKSGNNKIELLYLYGI